MTRVIPIALMMTLLTVVAPATGQAQPELGVRRYALLFSANDGGQGRARLKYAGSDAQKLSEVLVSLGGVEAKDRLLITDATPAQVRRQLKLLEAKLVRDRAQARRTEVIIYYSGHADERGLLLSGQRLDYDEIQGALAALSTPMKLLIVDSCHAGVLTRAKGGSTSPGFLQHYPSQIKGRAVLASGSASEVAQESDAIKASYFTHYLISGLRGGADTNRDGLVTLNEAYRFAFDETLARTQTSKYGAQHPEYAIELTGHGDLVLTQLAKASGVLRLGRSVLGKVRVQTKGQLRAEVSKPQAPSVTLALAPAQYEIYVIQDQRAYRARVNVGQVPLTLELKDFERVPLEDAQARGALSAESTAPLAFGVDLLPFVGFSSIESLRPRPRHASLNLVGGLAGGLSGVEIGGALNLHSGDVSGLQIGGVANMVDGELLGLQIGGVLNQTSARARALQIGGGLNLVGGDVSGLQIAGGLNLVSGGLRGLQIGGGFNIVGEQLMGLQIAGGANLLSAPLKGAQVGSFNLNQGGQGLQVGAINIAGESFAGVQLGAFNLVSGRARGLQVGAINIAQEGTAAIGAINIYTQGWTQLEASAQDGNTILTGVRHGSGSFFSLYGVGVAPFGDAALTYGLGFGWRLNPDQPLELSADLWAQQLIPGGTKWGSSSSQFRLRGLASIEVLPRFELFGGPTLALGMTWEDKAPAKPLWPAWTINAYDPILQLWPGLTLGARLKL